MRSAPSAAGPEQPEGRESLRTRSWLVIAVAGALVSVTAVVAGLSLRPDRSAGAPVAADPVMTASTTPAPALPTSGSTVPVQNAEPPAAGPAPASPAPVRITIGSLEVDAPIDPVGVDDQGAMGLPADVRRVGWYRYNPAPGASTGTVVLAGHVDSAEQGQGALFDLRSVDPGARIVVRSADGEQHVYRVTGRETIVKKRLPVERLFRLDGPPKLVIITCGGPFVARLHSYRDNLVVAAEPVAG